MGHRSSAAASCSTTSIFLAYFQPKNDIGEMAKTLPSFTNTGCSYKFWIGLNANKLLTYTNNDSPLLGGSNFGFPDRNCFFPGQ